MTEIDDHYMRDEGKPKQDNSGLSGINIAESTIKRVGGYLHRVLPIVDASGNILSYTLKPLMVEFKPRDVVQIIVGASLLAVPVSFTEEAWVLAETLPLRNVIYLATISLVFIAIFVFFNFYRHSFKGHAFSFFKRVFWTYVISAAIVALLLTIIQKCPWGVDNILAIKRVIIVSFPAAMSGTLSDTIK